MYYSKAMSIALFGKAVTSPATKGIVKSETDFTNFTADDFLRYWKSKAREHNVSYIAVKYKDRAVLKSLVNNFKATEIKIMMDYLWDSGEPIILKDGKLQYTSYGIFLLSGNFLNSIYNKAMWWYNNIKDTQQRGWEAEKESVSIDF